MVYLGTERKKQKVISFHFVWFLWVNILLVMIGYDTRDILDIFKAFTVCELHCNLKLKCYVDL